jgi:hypothetical protein
MAEKPRSRRMTPLPIAPGRMQSLVMRGKQAAGRSRIVVGLISAARIAVVLIGVDLIMESRGHGSSGPGRKVNRRNQGHPGGLMGKQRAAPKSMKTAPLPN